MSKKIFYNWRNACKYLRELITSNTPIEGANIKIEQTSRGKRISAQLTPGGGGYDGYFKVAISSNEEDGLQLTVSPGYAIINGERFIVGLKTFNLNEEYTEELEDKGFLFLRWQYADPIINPPELVLENEFIEPVAGEFHGLLADFDWEVDEETGIGTMSNLTQRQYSVIYGTIWGEC